MSGAATAVAVSVVSAGLAAAGMILLLPWLREVDPLGLSPVVLIAFGGGLILGWIGRGFEAGRAGGCVRPADPDPAGPPSVN